MAKKRAEGASASCLRQKLGRWFVGYMKQHAREAEEIKLPGISMLAPGEPFRLSDLFEILQTLLGAEDPCCCAGKLGGCRAPAKRPARGIPRWDGDRRILFLDGKVVKRFRKPAPNQELILAVFEEEGWPSKIDDPIPQDDEVDPKHRLHFTVANLSKRKANDIMRFFGDGTGQGIRWEPVADARTRREKCRREQ